MKNLNWDKIWDLTLGSFLILLVLLLIIAMGVEMYDTTIISHENLCNHK